MIQKTAYLVFVSPICTAAIPLENFSKEKPISKYALSSAQKVLVQNRKDNFSFIIQEKQIISINKEIFYGHCLRS